LSILRAWTHSTAMYACKTRITKTSVALLKSKIWWSNTRNKTSVNTFPTFINIFQLTKNLTEAYKTIEIAMRCCSLVSFCRSRLWLDERRFSLVSFHRSRFLLANPFYVSLLRYLFFVRESQYLWYKKIYRSTDAQINLNNSSKAHWKSNVPYTAAWEPLYYL